ncbi:hypothetical protein XBFFL1_2610002 [Xenorhabdus bovienii str. feltiae Florida]|uniref:Uncharacterized protein n=1 Tax=Xenorhabdus bovienii str. feltiae Moldova TaxID=1398200 RepID=A0A077NVA5_XENBV|nr:hypothetical protein XBFFR1_2550019 [Xenorhabdus bovienii str. feltiae France]CDG93644.1 hypothetical protein XBFFL1_2610002 [Xenorhabdus bovienii str. feltiae Florida]CDH02439.1 hypothetical protein XBFM1_2670009 [Xenorhabdus bovienii str. feltiae Moldova]
MQRYQERNGQAGQAKQGTLSVGQFLMISPGGPVSRQFMKVKYWGSFLILTAPLSY